MNPKPAILTGESSEALSASSRRRFPHVSLQQLRLATTAPWLLVAVPAMATIIVTILSFQRRGLSQDTAAWAQAAGSTIAICAAIWISDRESSRRRQERNDEQEASVWAILYALQLAERETADIYFQLKSSPLADDNEWQSWQTKLRNACAMLRYAANRIDHFHPGFAQEAHNAIILGDELIAILEMHRSKFKNGGFDQEDLLLNLGNHSYNFSVLGERISDRMISIRRRIARGKRINHNWEAYDGPKYFDGDSD